MEFACFDVVLALAALWLLGAFLTLRCGLHAALSPLCALSLYAALLTFGGIAGMLIARKLPGVDRLLHVLAVLRHPPHEGKRPRRAFARGRHVLRLHAPCARRRCMPSL